MALTDQTNRRILTATALVLLLCSVAIFWLTFHGPAMPKLSHNISPRAVSPASDRDNTTRSLKDFEPLLGRTLGAPLYDPPKDPIVDSTPIETPQDPPHIFEPDEVGYRLIGTMIEAGRSVAILVDPDGGILLAKEGETMNTLAGEGVINKIELNQVTLSLDDETVTLQVQ